MDINKASLNNMLLWWILDSLPLYQYHS